MVFPQNPQNPQSGWSMPPVPALPPLQRVAQVTPRFDGLYVAATLQPGWNLYLRFFPYGSACGTTSNQPMSVVAEVLRPRPPLGGHYRIAGPQITVTSTSRDGQVDYWGEIRGDGLEMRLHQRDHNQGYERFDVWQFLPLEGASAPGTARRGLGRWRGGRRR
ncbi:hypothetical protein FAIPA1_680005 [Frankia sp. AiPs1]|uniref:hypothetical protein n=1 Tax=Frankia sp. AiPa1 TaxID=573492 RepID=UPI00202B0C3E|nr:hypothetical protein [Frankia sp. AiPa1]MCL9758970.1 hypothetical protein [Frankia sp. AiPa1]